MSWWTGLLAGAALGTVLWIPLQRLLEHQMFQRTNFRGNPIATAGGSLLLVAAIAVEAVVTLLDVDTAATGARRVVFLLALAFGGLGLLDDLRGEGSVRGFRGHIRALTRGQLTTGGVKLLGGGVVALLGAWWLRRSPVEALVAGAVIALLANVTNLLDRAPGRTTKASAVLLGIALLAAPAAAREGGALVGAAVVAGAALALLPSELRERVMLGDTGSNVLGAAIGAGVAATASLPVLTAVALAALALNLLSEVRSYSDLIERNSVLRAFDQLGRRA